MASTLSIQPVDASFGAVVTGFRIAELDDATWRELHAAWLEHALLIFPGQFLTREEQIAFAKRFGPLEFEMSAISNVKEDGTLRRDKDNDDRLKILKGNMGWHADSTYMPVQAKGAVFSAEEVPTIGGQTGWADMRAAYDELDPATRARAEGLSAYHSLHYSQSKIGHDTRRDKADGEYSGYGFHDGPAPLRPLVKTHPETGRKSLAIGRTRTTSPASTPPSRSASSTASSPSPARGPAPGIMTGSRATWWCGTIAACCTRQRPGTWANAVSCGTAASPATRRASRGSPPDLERELRRRHALEKAAQRRRRLRADLLLEHALGAAPQRAALGHRLAPGPGDRDLAAAAVLAGGQPHQATHLERPQVVAERGAIHDERLGQRIDRDRPPPVDLDEQAPLRGAQPERHERLIVELGHLAGRLAQGQAIARGMSAHMRLI